MVENPSLPAVQIANSPQGHLPSIKRSEIVWADLLAIGLHCCINVFLLELTFPQEAQNIFWSRRLRSCDL